jgi:hypothetical protein
MSGLLRTEGQAIAEWWTLSAGLHVELVIAAMKAFALLPCGEAPGT